MKSFCLRKERNRVVSMNLSTVKWHRISKWQVFCVLKKLGADHSTSEGGGGGVGDFEKKYPASAYA